MARNAKWVRYGLREIALKGRRECMDKCRIDVSESSVANGNALPRECVAILFELLSHLIPSKGMCIGS
ncbi:hypothetical protein F2Q70_00017280 [Brassica cretica]|uniref:Uncharacterized protein n=1 Tax=Brassica cretica TaxID=69181 RepID=A0A8S9I0I5_BRACR|nr:hypothetical protein F2Q70_00017280 [Brassica cretica]KAF2598916.1 hypothetical protein F2Q68_00010231 [Brassica cretica]